MSSEVTLDVEFCRAQFPLLKEGWVFLENAGGTLVPQQVTNRITDYMTHNQVQPNEGYEASLVGQESINQGRAVLAALINADDDEIVVGPSTTSNVYLLSRALLPLFKPGDEIIVTNQDHEANNGAWRRLERHGLVIREWQMNPRSEDLEIEDLTALLSDRTKLVCVTHCSNVVGLVHDIKTMAEKVHAAGALICVDGVALTPHRRVDVKALDVDFYLYSPYKVFGPHLGVLYGKRELLAATTNESHYFLDDADFQRRLCPGGLNFELTAACRGIGDYFDLLHQQHFAGDNSAAQARLDRLFDLFSAHETKLANRIEGFLRSKNSVRLIGAHADSGREKVGVFAFQVAGQNVTTIPAQARTAKIGFYGDDFYAARCIDALGLREQGGVIRVSLAHYNSAQDVDRLIAALDPLIPD